MVEKRKKEKKNMVEMKRGKKRRKTWLKRKEE